MNRNAYDLEPEFSTRETARYALLPIPYERTTTYVKGTARGPEAILEASRQVELFDEVTATEPFRAGIWTAGPVEVDTSEPEEAALDRIECAARSLISEGKLVVGLGGEHTVSVPLIRAHASVYSGLHVLHLDAHADLRDSYGGSRYNHACAMARVWEICPVVSVGVRSLSAEEYGRIQGEKLPIFLAHEYVTDQERHARVLHRLGDPVYITIDLDVFDPSVAPAVGTPEPGGLGWYDVLSLLQCVVSNRRVVGVDVVELCPRPGDVTTDFLAAKLIYRILGLLEANRRGSPT